MKPIGLGFADFEHVFPTVTFDPRQIAAEDAVSLATGVNLAQRFGCLYDGQFSRTRDRINFADLVSTAGSLGQIRRIVNV